MAEPLVVKPAKAAQLLDMSRTAVYDLMRSGALPSVLIGGSRRIRVADIEQLIAEGAPNCHRRAA
jgi:excisionase family DNA binding protein